MFGLFLILDWLLLLAVGVCPAFRDGQLHPSPYFGGIWTAKSLSIGGVRTILFAEAVFVPLGTIYALWRAASSEIARQGGSKMTEVRTYRSPMRKLVAFFERSRDGWKRKRQEAKVLNRRLSNRVRKLEASRDLWKERARQQQQELRRLQVELEAEKKAVA
jgi:hypothetical protein